MKKLLFLSLVAMLALCPSYANAQKKNKKNQKQNPAVAAELNNATDSLSYALGSSLVQGLSQYLVQTGVLADTASVSSDFEKKIAAQQDNAKKQSLQTELKNKKDSIVRANQESLSVFFDGFMQGLEEYQSKKAHNFGITIANQLNFVAKGFAQDYWGDKSKMNEAAFVAAVHDGLTNAQAKIENPQSLLQTASATIQERKQTEEAEAVKKQYAKEIAEGDRFMEANKSKEGVVSLPSGLQYKILNQGQGKTPSASDRVKVHYRGTLIDGTPFDSSIDRGEPTVFGVGQVIKGWTEALTLMPVGSKWMLYIPYQLAYGTRDQGVIKPFSNLMFEVELISIEE